VFPERAAHRRCVPLRGRASEAAAHLLHTFRCVPQRGYARAAHQRCVPFREAAAHLMHIFDMQVQGLHI
jgi:hypothetical protein